MSFSNNNSALQNQLPISIEFPDDPKQFVEEFNDTYQGIVSAVNSKTGGLYVPIEKTNSEQYFSPTNPQKFRNVYRMTVDFGALPNTTSKSVPHNISWDSGFRLTRAYGAANDPVNIQALPIPNDGIMLENNSTTVTVTTNSDLSAYTETTIVLEYTKE